jgi:hypothetical protein
MWSTEYLDAPDFLDVKLFEDQTAKNPFVCPHNLPTEENSWID